MSSLRGYALQEQIDTEIVSAYAAAQVQVPAVASPPGWVTIGEFFLPKTVACVLEVIGSVSSPELIATCRLYDPDPLVDAPVAGSDVPFSSLISNRYRGAQVTLTGNKRYMIQLQGVGAAGVDKFVTAANACLGGV